MYLWRGTVSSKGEVRGKWGKLSNIIIKKRPFGTINTEFGKFGPKKRYLNLEILKTTVGKIRSY